MRSVIEMLRIKSRQACEKCDKCEAGSEGRIVKRVEEAWYA